MIGQRNTAVITTANQKGGSGKTSLVIGIAGVLDSYGYDISLIDTDPSAHLTDWFGRISPRRMHLRQIHDYMDLPKALKDEQGRADLVLIDTAGADAAINQSAIMAADLVLTPVQPSAFDAAMSLRIAKLVEACSITARRQIAHHVIMVQSARTNAAHHTREELIKAGLTILPIEVPSATEARETTWAGHYPTKGTLGVRYKRLADWIIKRGLLPSTPANK